MSKSLLENNGKTDSDKHFLTLTSHVGSDIDLGPVTRQLIRA